jgi:hypothetical protein
MRQTASMTRALTTLAGAVGAGALIWASSRLLRGDFSITDYWGIMGLLAAGGLVAALSQLLGGWTKGGTPTFSPTVFLLGFLPVLVVAGFVIWATQQPPGDGWLVDETRGFADDIGMLRLLSELESFLAVFPFAIGLFLGFCFDTVPREERDERVVRRRRRNEDVAAAEHPTEVRERSPDTEQAPTHRLTRTGEDERRD